MSKLQIICDCPKGADLRTSISSKGIVPIVLISCRLCGWNFVQVGDNYDAI